MLLQSRRDLWLCQLTCSNTCRCLACRHVLLVKLMKICHSGKRVMWENVRLLLVSVSNRSHGAQHTKHHGGLADVGLMAPCWVLSTVKRTLPATSFVWCSSWSYPVNLITVYVYYSTIHPWIYCWHNMEVVGVIPMVYEPFFSGGRVDDSEMVWVVLTVLGLGGSI